MRIMLDTNVLLSALLFPSERMNRLIELVAIENTMVLSSYVVNELKTVVERKFPHKLDVIDRLLSIISYELVYTPTKFDLHIDIRDEKDYPVIATALLENVDILITGDKDFTELTYLPIEILTPTQFLEKYA
ncbi:putative toxin-antitoxin system toxin component, PIN family [Pasteurellaceae bacterium USgator11]|nr:putative toxin-antitoxin system toxin component, PIN family [Pasteurellaceae bacterium USgator41]TNG92176.1 putative toxin-antitoxin system toxin component, PIN family [Pasteurellaceae bacterium UScroc12]TNG98044.1 putative toxin-antitoxin system toxin component, PIN family [Pasteurellaceae bacterium UScroc31]TNG99294.1 putative toxin-antitoxin system toxin component, PIN family [Pasteurellaceae bacterium USgator11]